MTSPAPDDDTDLHAYADGWMGPEQSAAFAKLLHSEYNLDVAIPAPGQSFELV